MILDPSLMGMMEATQMQSGSLSSMRARYWSDPDRPARPGLAVHMGWQRSGMEGMTGSRMRCIVGQLGNCWRYTVAASIRAVGIDLSVTSEAVVQLRYGSIGTAVYTPRVSSRGPHSAPNGATGVET
jgi:hypothetical protein